MNIFDVINTAINLYLDFFWITIPLTVYLVIEVNKYEAGETQIYSKIAKKFRDWRESR